MKLATFCEKEIIAFLSCSSVGILTIVWGDFCKFLNVEKLKNFAPLNFDVHFGEDAPQLAPLILVN